MSDYPTWYCPVYSCPYRTSYSRNIKKHLTEVHNFSEEKAEAEVNNFFDAHLKDAEIICSKPPSDPTSPQGVGVASVVGSEAKRSEAERSVSVFEGGGCG